MRVKIDVIFDSRDRSGGNERLMTTTTFPDNHNIRIRLAIALAYHNAARLVALQREARAEFNVGELCEYLVACENWWVLGSGFGRREPPERRERRVRARVREERRRDAPEALARRFARSDGFKRRVRDNDLVEARLHEAACEVLHLLSRLHEQAAVRNLDCCARAVTEPDEEPREARLAVDREQVQV